MPAVASAQAERTIAPDDIDAYIKEFEQDPRVTEPSFPRNARAASEVECSDIGFIYASPPLRISSYSVRKVVETCAGRVDRDYKPIWSREFGYTIRHTLTQRRHHKVEMAVSTPGFPYRVFIQDYELKEDRRLARDPVVESLQTVNIGTSTVTSEAAGNVPENRGTYYLQATGAELSIPSLGYNMKISKWNGARLTIGRFECAPFNHGGSNSLCVFGDPVDDR